MKLNINWNELGIAVITQSTQNEDASGDAAAPTVTQSNPVTVQPSIK